MSDITAGKTILWAGSPKVDAARVIRTDGRFIKSFDYEERLKGTDFFEKWISDNMFNLEGVDDSDKKAITYWVS